MEDGESEEAYQKVAQIEECKGVDVENLWISNQFQKLKSMKYQSMYLSDLKYQKEAPSVPEMYRKPISTTHVSEVEHREAPKDTDIIVGGLSRAET